MLEYKTWYGNFMKLEIFLNDHGDWEVIYLKQDDGDKSSISFVVVIKRKKK